MFLFSFEMTCKVYEKVRERAAEWERKHLLRHTIICIYTYSIHIFVEQTEVANGLKPFEVIKQIYTQTVCSFPGVLMSKHRYIQHAHLRITSLKRQSHKHLSVKWSYRQQAYTVIRATATRKKRNPKKPERWRRLRRERKPSVLCVCMQSKKTCTHSHTERES